jgi:uncharacterized protein YraI
VSPYAVRASQARAAFDLEGGITPGRFFSMFVSRKTLIVLGALAAATMSTQSAAAAQDAGYVTANLNLRAGPGSDYPVVATMTAGDGVTIYGCLSGWSWCDIDWRGNRGWAAGRYLQVTYHDRREPIYSYGGYVGLPFITFGLDSYWGDHYRHRPFYHHMPRYRGHDHNHDGRPGADHHRPPPHVSKPPHHHQSRPPHSSNPVHHEYRKGKPPHVNGAPPKIFGHKPKMGNAFDGGHHFRPLGLGNHPSGNHPSGNHQGCRPDHDNDHGCR